MYLLILKSYLEVIKPGIIFGNIILLLGGFFLASHLFINFYLLFYSILGTIFVIASACIFNNLIDRSIDKKMIRTQNRVLVLNKIKPQKVFIFGCFLGIIGISILGFLVNILSMFLSIFGFIIYVFLYTYIYKKTSIHSTLIGSFSGSVPSSIGYTAVSNNFDLCCLLLYITIIFWQMSHFYSISIFRIRDYKIAEIPVFAVVNGIFSTKNRIIFYTFMFLFSTSLFTFFGYLSYYFLFFSLIVNCFWLYLSLRNIYIVGFKKYSYQMFYFSIIVIMFFNFLLSIDCIFFKSDML